MWKANYTRLDITLPKILTINTPTEHPHLAKTIVFRGLIKQKYISSFKNSLRYSANC